MRGSRFAFGLLAVTAALLACKKSDEPQPDPVVVAPAPTAAPAPAPEPEKPKIVDFRGKYTSSYGKITITQHGKNVNGLYGRNGALDCKVDGRKLDCKWDEDRIHGKAELELKDDGKIKGRWGRNSSSTNGGYWLFIPLDDDGKPMKDKPVKMLD